MSNKFGKGTKVIVLQQTLRLQTERLISIIDDNDNASVIPGYQAPGWSGGYPMVEESGSGPTLGQPWAAYQEATES